MTRFVDQGALVAAAVGIGMALVVATSFLLVIPIEPIYWLMALPAGLLIGYYANQRSDRRSGPWSRIVLNAAFAGLVTGLTFAVLLLIVKALFFVADDGYRDASSGGRIECETGADCVYRRYLAADRGPGLEAAGVRDPDSFTRLYWTEQLATAGTLSLVTLGGGLAGGFLYGVARPRAPRPSQPQESQPIG